MLSHLPSTRNCGRLAIMPSDFNDQPQRDKELSNWQRQQRMNIRNFLLTASIDELKMELEISNGYDKFRASVIREMINAN